MGYVLKYRVSFILSSKQPRPRTRSKSKSKPLNPTVPNTPPVETAVDLLVNVSIPFMELSLDFDKFCKVSFYLHE